MRSFWNCLGDPSLHLLTVAMIVVYLAFSRGAQPGDSRAEAPLATCTACHGYYLPGKTCECRSAGHIAHALP
jgi:hypothetical protein